MTDPIASLQAALAGRYVIDRPLGQGGMATVYLAHDVRHDRQVALKVLRPELAAVIGAERFLAEIKTTANLQHPHILPLFDSGAVDGTVFYVMPFVEGESLRDRLAREKQIPVAEAVRIATEVAGALDYAHRHGVIHRDIKPENILLHDGQAMVADFGIALAAVTTGGGRMTETGMSLGTPHYMSPEQAMGERALDARTDVYALGCVLHEMLSGDPPFQGSSAQAIVAKVMTEKPASIRNFRDTVPESLEEAVLIALAKLPADRFPSAAAFRDALRDADKAPARLGPGRSTSSRRTAGRRTALGMAGVIAVGSVAVAAGILWRRPVDRPVSRYALAFPAAQAPSAPAEFAISADGSVLVYLGPGPGADQLWVKHRDQAEAVARAHLAGWSLGGNEVTMMAGKYPERVDRLVYLDAAYDWADPASVAALQTLPITMGPPASAVTSLDAFRDWHLGLFAPGLADRSLMEAYLRDLLDIQPDGTVRPVTSDSVAGKVFAAILSDRREYTKVKAPVLAIYSEVFLDATRAATRRSGLRPMRGSRT